MSMITQKFAFYLILPSWMSIDGLFLELGICTFFLPSVTLPSWTSIKSLFFCLKLLIFLTICECDLTFTNIRQMPSFLDSAYVLFFLSVPLPSWRSAERSAFPVSWTLHNCLCPYLHDGLLSGQPFLFLGLGITACALTSMTICWAVSLACFLDSASLLFFSTICGCTEYRIHNLYCLW